MKSMKSILITGSSGFVGRNLLNKLALDDSYEVFIVDRDFKNIFPYVPQELDWVIHLASSHREIEEQLVYDKNKIINESLVNLMNEIGLTSNILFTSSIYEEGDSVYGRSKKEGGNYLEMICAEWNTSFEKIVFPNLFGPFAKPYHTSVVANFCMDIIMQKEGYVNNVELKLLYIQDAVNSILKFKSQSNFSSTSVYLPDLYKTIQRLNTAYQSDSFDLKLTSRFESQLLSTLSSYY